MRTAEDDASADPLKDPDRLREIVELDLLSLRADALLERLAREAAERLDLPIGVVTIVLDEAQYFRATHGVGGWMAASRGTPVEWSFCRNVIRRRGDFVVENAAEDAIMRNSPLVTIDGIRCYAGVPLTSSRGQVLGAFCVQGTQERRFTQEDLELLRGMAAQAVLHLEESRRSGPDAPVTV